MHEKKRKKNGEEYEQRGYVGDIDDCATLGQVIG